MRKPLVQGLICLVVGVAAGFALRGTVGLGGDPPPAGKDVPKAGKLAGVVILCLDTLRHDVATPDESKASDAAGASRVPSLDHFARGNIRLSGAIAPCSWTGPSVASILTGLLPRNHGLRDAQEGARIPAAVPTLASALRAAGWSTSASTAGGWVSAYNGMNGGFDRFAEDFDDLPPAESVRRWSDWRQKTSPDAPFLLVLHTYAPHDPFGDKRVIAEKRCFVGAADHVADGRAQAERMKAAKHEDVPALLPDFVFTWTCGPCRRFGMATGLGDAKGRELWEQFCLPWLDGDWKNDPKGPATVARMREAYVDALPSVDRVVAETLAALGALLPMKDVLTVILSDHGEAFGEHGVVYHARHVTDELARVPLVLHVPGIDAHLRVDTPCSLIDLAPTILEVAKVAPIAPMDGKSLLPVILGDEKDRCVESSTRPPVEGPEGHLRRTAVRCRAATWMGVFDAKTKTWTTDAWYDRAADPQEHAPLATPPAALADPAFQKAVDAARAAAEQWR